METLRHGLNIRTQNVPNKTPNKFDTSPYSERTDTPQSRHRGGFRPVYKVCTNLSDFFPEKFFLECFCKVQMIPEFMGSEFALQ